MFGIGGMYWGKCLHCGGSRWRLRWGNFVVVVCRKCDHR